MGLKDKLKNDGSIYAAEKNGGAILPNSLEYADSINTIYNLTHSSLHFDEATETPSYSVDGTNKVVVNNYFIKYKDGVANQLPTPTAFDFEDSVTADPNNKPKYTTKKGKTYLENLPT
jgi:hypothetical protein